MSIRFVYFDLGKVIVDFQVERMLDQVGRAAGCAPEAVSDLLFDKQLLPQLERGELTSEQFYKIFCDRTGSSCTFDELVTAASDIFSPIDGTARIIHWLVEECYPLGVLSNTSQAHWEFVERNFEVVQKSFDVRALSYELGCLKPDPAIYRKAADLAGYRTQEIFFVDDRVENVEAARQFGFNAVQFTDAPTLAESLRAVGVEVEGV